MMSFDIGVVHRTTPYLLADLVELLILVSGESYLSKSDVSDLINSGVKPADEEDSDDAAGMTSAEENQKEDKYVEDLWGHFQYRQVSMDSLYPFKVDGTLLTLNTDWSSKEHRIYRMLLVCSRLRSFSRTNRVNWAKVFTDVSKVALSGLLPSNASVHIFDANSDDRKTIYGTNLRDALKVLGNHLRVLSIEEEVIGEQNSSGDAGIDLVGYVNFKDPAHGSHFILGQCGAQEQEWPTKVLESHPIKLSALFNFGGHHGVTSMLIPLCYRNSDGKWYNRAKCGGALLLDRPRILELCKGESVLDSITNNPRFINFEEQLSKVESPI